MIDINPVIASIIWGYAVSCGAVLVVAGASKLYRGMRDLDDMTAIRRALRMPRRQWRLTGLAAGGVECVTGVLVCSGAYPVLGGAGMAGLGAVFCVLLAYVLVKQIPGGCGCIRWRTAPETAAEAVTWRAMARSGMLLGAGIAYMIVSADAANAPRRDWFGQSAPLTSRPAAWSKKTTDTRTRLGMTAAMARSTLAAAGAGAVAGGAGLGAGVWEATGAPTRPTSTTTRGAKRARRNTVESYVNATPK